MAAAVVAACLVAPASAFASSDCTTDADCGDGFTCQEIQEPCPATPCQVGQDCTNNCQPTTTHQCEPEPPASCTSVSDCSGNDVCVTYSWEECSGTAVACADGKDCDAGAAPDTSCTTHTEGYCLPPYLAPCTTASDCGAGFTCEEEQSCVCSGSGGSGSGSAGSSTGTSTGADPATPDAGMADAGSGTADAGTPEDNCSCQGTGTKYCKLIETECTNDTDCPGDMVCADGPDSASSTTCSVSSDGTTDCPDAGTSGSATKYCMPPDYERWAGASRGGGDTAAYEPQSGASSNGGSGTSSGSAEHSEHVVDVDRGGHSTASSGGCSSTGMGGAASGSLAGLALFFLGLVGIRRRRC